MTDIKTPKNAIPKICLICNFKCSKQSEWNRHISARKHIILTENILNTPTEVSGSKCACGKIYKHRQSLFNHKKKCTYITNIVNIELQNVTDQINHAAVPVPVSVPIPSITNEMILNLINQNQELQKQLIELSSQTKIVNNTTMNNQFNLNMFLNEDCKDALNIVDFVESLKLTVNDLEQTGKLGYADGIARIFIQALKRLDVNMRPLHCTDTKRETVYIKDQDIWEKENAQKTKLRNVLHQIARKNLKMIPLWQEQNPNFQYLDTRENNNFLQISLSALGPGSREDLDKQEDKIIRNVLKEVSLEKNKRLVDVA